MPTSPATETSKRRRSWTWLFLVLVGAPATVAVALIGILAMGPFGLAVPLVLVGAVFVYRAVVASCVSTEGRAVTREVGALLLASALGLGTWVALLILGITIEVLPFLVEEQHYPYADEWSVLSMLTSGGVACVAWWLLRRWADPSLRRL